MRHPHEAEAEAASGPTGSGTDETDETARNHGHEPHPLRITTTRPALAVLGATDRPSPMQTALAAVADPGVHIERVWPMCSPSTEPLEAFSSAYFHIDRPGSPPPGITPVVGLQMNQPYAHEPVMASEVIDLLAPVPPGLVVDATLGGGGHAAALLDGQPGRAAPRDRP